MTMAVAVTWHARSGSEERVEAILAEMTAPTRTEPGCLMYEPHRAAAATGVYFIYEQFVDEAAFEAHIASEHYRRLILGEAVTILDHRERSLYTTLDPV
ncbi:MAG: putative quinol monooxygenase [Candidatus Dormibacteria bacterium]